MIAESGLRIAESQMELPIAKRATVNADQVAFLLALLAGKGWQTAAQIGGWGERKIRALANASAGQVLSYPGSPGYRLTREASIGEIETAVAKLRHQAVEMDRRATQINRVRHAHGNGGHRAVDAGGGSDGALPSKH